MEKLKKHYVYILRCADDTLYTGYTTDPARRLEEHNRGIGAKYTRARLPVDLVYVEEGADKSWGLRREAAIKKLRRKDKLELIMKAGDKHGKTSR
ncbi:GIY-YIG nuclease family protein [Aedoeadaptatus coli]|uniref:GIY-YIG nuclease family protein n=1 Tax=Aedoeadaptatus coli TaxID=2058292 RepID=UPI000D55482F